MMDWLTQFFGRLHPMIVHFPIGILLLTFLFECLSHIKAYENVRVAIKPALVIGAISAVVAALTGYFLSQEDGYDDALLITHRNLGFATAASGLIAVFVYGKVLNRLHQKKENVVRIILLTTLTILVSLTGHWGGSITHGEDYWYGFISDADDISEPLEKLRAVSNIDSAVFYPDVIQPILESRCYSCHSSKKQKGDLRLDDIALIKRGGENGEVLTPGIPDSSTLYQRMMLPLEDEDHMPPNEKPQPSSSEIALIQTWIMEGASFNMKVYATRNADKIKGYFNSLVEQSQKQKLVPEKEVPAADTKILDKLISRGIITLPVGKESNYLSISFLNKRSVSVDDLRALTSLKEQIVWLNLAHTNVSDSAMTIVSQLTSLRRLNLEFTSVSDNGIQALASLSDLHYLNLVSTKVTDATLQHLSKIKSLQNVFLYQTDVTKSGIENFISANPTIGIDTGGYKLPQIPDDTPSKRN
jgi:uncharacterized membrane protein